MSASAAAQAQALPAAREDIGTQDATAAAHAPQLAEVRESMEQVSLRGAGCAGYGYELSTGAAMRLDQGVTGLTPVLQIVGELCSCVPTVGHPNLVFPFPPRLCRRAGRLTPSRGAATRGHRSAPRAHAAACLTSFPACFALQTSARCRSRRAARL
jgi:hypothetical protein